MHQEKGSKFDLLTKRLNTQNMDHSQHVHHQSLNAHSWFRSEANLQAFEQNDNANVVWPRMRALRASILAFATYLTAVFELTAL